MLSKTGGKIFCFQTGEVKILVLCIAMGKRSFVVTVHWEAFSFQVLRQQSTGLILNKKAVWAVC